MKKVFKSIIKILAQYTALVLTFVLVAFPLYAKTSAEIMSMINTKQQISLIASIAVIIMIIAHISSRLQNVIKKANETPKDIFSMVETGIKPVLTKNKLICYLLIFIIASFISGICVYAFSVISGIEITIRTLLTFCSIFSFGMAILSAAYQDFIKPLIKHIPRKSRNIIFFVTFLVLVALNTLFVPHSIARIDTYHSYWNSGHDVPYSFEYKIDNNHAMIIQNEDGLNSDAYIKSLDAISHDILRNFVDSGWTISIDSDYLAEYSWRQAGKNHGTLYQYYIDNNSKTIIISNADSLSDNLLANRAQNY